MSARKVLTKKEAIQVAYYVAEKLSAHPIDDVFASSDSELVGSWIRSSFTVETDDFSIAAGRTKHHYDKRIRDNWDDVSGLIYFAIFCAEKFPDIHACVAQWSENLKDLKLVAGTIEDRAVRKLFTDWAEPAMSLNDLKTLIKHCEVTMKMAA
jgi:hypothetical protein